MLHVADNADDLTIKQRAHSDVEALADRVFAGEEPFRHRLIDNNHARRIFRIALGEKAASEQRNAHRFEIARRYREVVRVRLTAGGVRRTALDNEYQHEVVSAERRDNSGAGRLYAGQRRYLLDQLRVEGHSLTIFRVFPL